MIRGFSDHLSIRSFELLPKRRQLLLHFREFSSQFRHFIFQAGNAIVAC